jgi:flagellar hook-associated protein 2
LLNTGGTDPLKLVLGATKSGLAGRLLIDSGTTSLALAESQQARDAVIELSGAGAAPILFTSATNTFTQTVQGVSLQIAGTSTAPVTVTVSDDSTSLKNAVNSFVATFNTLSASIAKQTAFDSATVTRGLLQGDGAALQAQSVLFGLVSRRYGSGTGSIRTFADVGITIKGGQLSFDAAKLEAALTTDPAGVRDFFSAADSGAAAVMKKSVAAFTDVGTGILFQRIDALDRDVEAIEGRIDQLNAALERKRAKIENQFLVLERALSQVQNQQSSLATLSGLVTQSFSRSPLRN